MSTATSEDNTITVSSYSGGPSELDKEVSAFIAEASKEFAYDESDSDPATENKSSEAADAKATGADTAAGGDGFSAGGEGAKDKEGTGDVAKEGKPPEDRGFDRLVEREVALQSKERVFQEKERAFLAMEERIRELESRALPQNLAEQFETSPETALKSMGLDPENIVRMIITQRLGDKADPAMRGIVESAKIKKELSDLKRQFQDQAKTAQAQAYVAKVEAETRAYINKGISEEAPAVAEVAKTNPDRVYREIMEEIAKDANLKMSKGLGGDILTHDEAAKRVEDRWSELRSVFSPKPAPGAKQDTSANESLKKTEPEARKESPPVTKPPEKPLAPWLRKSDSELEGVRAGIAEFKRTEGLK